MHILMHPFLYLLFCAHIAAARCVEANDGSVVCDDGDTMLPGVVALAIIIPFIICIFLCVPWNGMYYTYTSTEKPAPK